MFLREQVVNDDPAIFVANRAFVIFLQVYLQNLTYLFPRIFLPGVLFFL